MGWGQQTKRSQFICCSTSYFLSQPFPSASFSIPVSATLSLRLNVHFALSSKCKSPPWIAHGPLLFGTDVFEALILFLQQSLSGLFRIALL